MGDSTELTVRVIAPSSNGKPSNLEVFRRWLWNAGMTPRVSDAIYGGDDPFYANTDERRADDLADALADDSAVVWCVRGGKGASRLIPLLERLPDDWKRRVRAQRKALVGFSDVTALHAYLIAEYGWQTLHGPMLEQIADDAVDRDSVDALLALLHRRSARVRYDLRLLPGPKATPVLISSRVIGGNLTLVEAGVGTAWQLRAAGRVVFLEDVDCRAYALERSLDHLQHARLLQDAAAVVFGSFVQIDPPHLSEFVLARFAATAPFPVFRVDGIGHGPVNGPLPLNTDAVIGRCLDDGTDSAGYTLTVENIYTEKKY